MRGTLQLLIWLSASVGAAFAVLVTLPLWIDVDAFRPQIERQVSRALERQVTLGGGLTLEPSVTPRVIVNGVKIANPDWASRPFLAEIDKLSVKVRLLPLLQGRLEIVSLEFHNVDLLLEQQPGGANNFTFGEPGQASLMPTIEQMSLYEADIAYVSTGGPVRRFYLERLTTRWIPQRPLELQATTAFREIPVRLSLRGEPPAWKQQQGAWRVTLQGQAGDLSFQVRSNVEDPRDWDQGEYQLELSGHTLDTLSMLSGYRLPETGPYAVSAKIGLDLDEHLRVTELAGQIGASDVRGDFHWNMQAQRPALEIRLESQRLDLDTLADLGAPGDITEDKQAPFWEQPLDLNWLTSIDLNLTLQARRLDGLGVGTLRDVTLNAANDPQQLRVTSAASTPGGSDIQADALLPWASPTATQAPDGVSLTDLLQRAEIDATFQAPKPFYEYATTLMGSPLAFAISRIEARSQPGANLILSGQSTLNGKPVELTLEGQPLKELLRRPKGPWRDLALNARGEALEADVTGSLARPWEFDGFDISYLLQGNDSGAFTPLKGPFTIAGRYLEHPNRLNFEPLKIQLGGSDLAGRLVWHRDRRRPRMEGDLEAKRLRIRELLPPAGQSSTDAPVWEQPLAIDQVGGVDLDLALRVQRLEGLARPLQELVLAVHARNNSLQLEPIRARWDDIGLDGRLQLPWGERLAALSSGGVRLAELLRHAGLDLQAEWRETRPEYRMTFMEHSFELGLARIVASARPEQRLRLNAEATLDDEPLQVQLEAEPLGKLLKSPEGPWRNLALQASTDDSRFEATGGVERPLEARGFDIQFALSGSEIDTLLPIVSFIVPIGGDFSLNGRFVDLPDRNQFDELELRFGHSDISGRFSIYKGTQRPRLVANFHSEQLYLVELLPVTETEERPRKTNRVIPDYELPIERLRGLDIELHFSGKRLQTQKGVLGDINFHVSLKEGLLKVTPLSVRGWAGALIESSIEIDAAQDPPPVAWTWVARQLDYGLLLKQAGLAETVEGTVDVTLHLTGTGDTRREFLSNADGELLIIGEEGKFASSRLDLWGSALVTTMLSRQWRRDDVTKLNCLVARIRIEDGIASSDDLLLDTQHVTIGASGSLNLASEELDLVLAPRPKRTTLVSLSNPAHLTGTLRDPEVSVAVLPGNRLAAAGGGLLATLVNPAYLVFAFTKTGTRHDNPCVAAIEEVMAKKAGQDKVEGLPATPPPRRFSLLPGCSAEGPNR